MRALLFFQTDDVLKVLAEILERDQGLEYAAQLMLTDQEPADHVRAAIVKVVAGEGAQETADVEKIAAIAEVEFDTPEMRHVKRALEHPLQLVPSQDLDEYLLSSSHFDWNKASRGGIPKITGLSKQQMEQFRDAVTHWWLVNKLLSLRVNGGSSGAEIKVARHSLSLKVMTHWILNYKSVWPLLIASYFVVNLKRDQWAMCNN